MQLVEDGAQQHGRAPIVSIENGVEQVLAISVDVSFVDIEHFGTAEGVVEVDEDLEVEHAVVDMGFDLNEGKSTKKERPASDIKKRLKVMFSFWYSCRLDNSLRIRLPLISWSNCSCTSTASTSSVRFKKFMQLES